jgi:simple sugar transport system substrate-binding protein
VIFSVTHDILGDPFWTIYDRGVAAARDCFGCEVKTFRPARYTPAEVRALVSEVAQDRPDGLLCTVPDAAVMDEPLRAAIAEGIPVVVANAPDLREPPLRIPYLRYIGGDDRESGRLAARQLLQAGAGHYVLCFDHYLDDQHCHSERFTGLHDVITQHGGLCRRIAMAGDNSKAAAAVVGDALADHPTADGIVTLGPPGASAVLQVTDRLAATIKHVTFDLSDEQLAAMRAGRLLAIIDSQQYLQGFFGIQVLCHYLRYGLLPTSDILTGPTVIDAANLAAACAAHRTGVR